MKNCTISILCLLTFLIVSAQNKIVGYKPDIEPYISFIKEQNQAPISYLLGKYKTYDVLVFGERDHRDITQYYFIEKLINMPEFYSQVGTIYTEAGSSNFNDTLNKVLQNRSMNERETRQKLLELYREISYQAYWEKYNFFYLWETVYRFNKTHPEYPIRIEMTSHPFNWNEIHDTATCRLRTNEVERNYDKSMADYFLGSYAQKQGSARNKAFVIMNYPHSLRKWTSSANKTNEKFFGSFISKELSDKICYVIVNPYNLNIQPVVDGKWEAAFKYCDYPAIGFDFKDTPFGKDTFDVWPLVKGILSYQELYDGMVYINPTTKVENVIGIPGFLDRKFAKEYIRRMKLRMYIYRGIDYKTTTRREILDCNHQRAFSVYENIKYQYGNDPEKDFDKQVNHWLINE